MKGAGILLTGFEPWGRNRSNPSGEVARLLGGEVLPVNFEKATATLLRLIRERRPNTILMLGLGPGCTRICIEAVAMNVDHCEERAHRRWRQPILRGWPMTLMARFPLDAVHKKLRAARLPVALSYHAGTFLCNHVFFRGLAHARVPCGFVHLPPEKQVSLKKQLRAVKLILGSL